MDDKKRNKDELNSFEVEPDLFSSELAQLISERKLPSPSKKTTRAVMRAARRSLRENSRERREPKRGAWLSVFRMRAGLQWALASTASLALAFVIWKLIFPVTVQKSQEIVSNGYSTSAIFWKPEEGSLDDRLSMTLARARKLKINCRGSGEPSGNLSSGISRRLEFLRDKAERLRKQVAKADQYPDFSGPDVQLIPGKSGGTINQWKEV